MSNVLDRILADKRDHVARSKRERPLGELAADARQAAPPRAFLDRLARASRGDGYGLIAELKKASPSKGLIRADFDPPALARAYRAGGASCLSVLTDRPYFQGDDRYLAEARAAVDLPVLRKDFMIDPYQVVEARALGADCILLIMAALGDGQAAELEQAAGEQGMDVLVEVHDGHELDRALRLESRLIGINNRNLKSLEVDLATAEQLAPGLPANRIAIAESGLNNPADLARMARAGCRCFLVGESLMRQPDITQATAALLTRPARRAVGA